MRDQVNILQVANLKPDFMGFIFYPKSNRFVGEDFMMPGNFPVQIKRVGVFVNESTPLILQQAQKNRLDYVQLHGDESPGDCAQLKKSEIGVIKVFSVDQSFDFTETKLYQAHVDFFLFDTKSENYGGSGKSFDWKLLNQYDQQVPFFLSGGISPETIHDIGSLKGMNLSAVDVNSGTEVAPGLKDIAKVKSIKEILNSKF
ncbi:MAG TPA: phosphoribosylanthranilate isomerase [Cyclobacteriaceae bacterium]|nr:phosphoribosylanthranilate isomerase [Cyclobacteriaceae bacterium]